MGMPASHKIEVFRIKLQQVILAVQQEREIFSYLDAKDLGPFRYIRRLHFKTNLEELRDALTRYQIL